MILMKNNILRVTGFYFKYSGIMVNYENKIEGVEIVD